VPSSALAVWLTPCGPFPLRLGDPPWCGLSATCVVPWSIEVWTKTRTAVPPVLANRACKVIAVMPSRSSVHSVVCVPAAVTVMSPRSLMPELFMRPRNYDMHKEIR
jgi:hypothetical protein